MTQTITLTITPVPVDILPDALIQGNTIVEVKMDAGALITGIVRSITVQPPRD